MAATATRLRSSTDRWRHQSRPLLRLSRDTTAIITFATDSTYTPFSSLLVAASAARSKLRSASIALMIIILYSYTPSFLSLSPLKEYQ